MHCQNNWWIKDRIYNLNFFLLQSASKKLSAISVRQWIKLVLPNNNYGISFHGNGNHGISVCVGVVTMVSLSNLVIFSHCGILLVCLYMILLWQWHQNKSICITTCIKLFIRWALPVEIYKPNERNKKHCFIINREDSFNANHKNEANKNVLRDCWFPQISLIDWSSGASDAWDLLVL